MNDRVITIYHSPDADDAFMFYGLTAGAVKIPGFTFEHRLSDIESLNHRALKGELECTAVSVHAFPYLQDRYAIMDCGASMGDATYGPKVIARSAFPLESKRPLRIALPGEYTSTTLALKLYLLEKGIEAETTFNNFDEIQGAVKAGKFDCGAIIHEGQLTYAREGLVQLIDLGEWWWNKTRLPLPLGVNIVRKDIGEEAMNAATTALRQSVEYSLSHRDAALEYALSYGRGISPEDADTFVGMYVNKRTLSLEEDGRRSINLFLSEGVAHGLIPPFSEIEYTRPK